MFMQKSLVALSIIATLGLAACQPSTTDKETDATTSTEVSTAEMTDAQKQAYAMGASMGMFIFNREQQTAQVGDTLDKEAIMKGFKDGMANDLAFTTQEIQEFAQAGEAQLQAKQQAFAEKASEENIAKGIEYLAENAKRDGVITTDSGLQYEILTEGTGVNPKAEDTVKVHYKGTLIDGTEFDSSYSRGEPAEFPLNRVIAGWTEGVQLMKEGGKFRFYIPSDLAYGSRSMGVITPNSTLIFDVELLEVTPATTEAAESE
jgi:FKBP-type peptidyl-prolyl cis-trans isomerase FkpA